MQSYFDHFSGQWHPGWRGIRPALTLPLFAAIVLFTLDLYFIANVSSEMISQKLSLNISLGITTFLLIMLFAYSLNIIIKEVLRGFSNVVCFIDASAIQDRPPLEQFKICEEGGDDTENVKLAVHFAWFLGFIPGAFLAAGQLRVLGAIWMLITLLSAFLFSMTVLWKVPEKNKLLKVFRISLIGLMHNIQSRVGVFFGFQSK